jgi:hypothetical protein
MNRQGVAQRADAHRLQHNCMVTRESGGQTKVGKCQGISPAGELLLETPTGIFSFASGVIRR